MSPSPSPSPTTPTGVPLPSTDHSPTNPTCPIITLSLNNTHRFTTRSSTLTSQSHFFASLFSGKWGDQKQPDGTYFLDSDPETFTHVLRYLRSGVCPVFWSKDKGWDYGLYAQVLEQAKFFGVEKLVDWIEGKKYERAVRVERTTRVIAGTEEMTAMYETVGVGEKVEYFPFWKTERVYLCPRGLDVHRGRPDRCGRQCRNAMGEETLWVDEQVLKVLEVRERVCFDGGLVLEGG